MASFLLWSYSSSSNKPTVPLTPGQTLCERLNQEKKDFYKCLVPKLGVLAEVTFQQVANVPQLQWKRFIDYEYGSSSGFGNSGSKAVLVLSQELDLTRSTLDAIQMVLNETMPASELNKTRPEALLADARELLDEVMTALFKDSGFKLGIHATTMAQVAQNLNTATRAQQKGIFTPPDDPVTKEEEPDSDSRNNNNVILRVTLRLNVY